MAISEDPRPMAATLQSSIQGLTALDTLPLKPIHPFASSEKTYVDLNNIFKATSSISDALNAYLPLQLENPKLISLLKQHTAASHSLYLSEQVGHQTLSSLKSQVGLSYGEDIPLDRKLIVEWCISRLEAWGSSVGMEAFKEEERQGKMTVVLGGKVLVMDVDFDVDRSDPLFPKLDIAGLKTSYASPTGGATTEGSTSMNGFLADVLREFLLEVQRPTDAQDPQKAASLSKKFSTHLRYLMRLDLLASQEGDSGIRWFNNIDTLALAAESHARSEASSVAKALSMDKTPLDIFLARSHALPLPYLLSPSLTFLIYISPLAYLSLIRTLRTFPGSPSTKLPNLDIPVAHLRSQFSSKNHNPGLITACLRVTDVSKPREILTSEAPPTVKRPVFALDSSMGYFKHAFPQVAESGDMTLPQTAWVLDFTDAGKLDGVVMSQSRMRDIELLVNPFSHQNVQSPMGMVDTVSFPSGSWVDLVINPSNPISPERYTSVYASPSSSHPRLNLRLTAPKEPGFILEQVQVRDIKEVWGILEIVREQCWLNGIIKGCTWSSEGFAPEQALESANELNQVDDETLQSVLNGTYQPRQIPINISFPTGGHQLSAFDSIKNSGGAKIVMTLPEKPPISGLVEISVSHDATRPRGVAVDVSGAMSSDLNIDVLEEACRRGGIFSLPGRVWTSSGVS